MDNLIEFIITFTALNDNVLIINKSIIKMNETNWINVRYSWFS